jgi:hypothetical protein
MVEGLRSKSEASSRTEYLSSEAENIGVIRSFVEPAKCADGVRLPVDTMSDGGIVGDLQEQKPRGNGKK